jgi:hypothetical protein
MLPAVLFVIAAVACVVILTTRRKIPLSPEAQFVVRVDDGGIRLSSPDGAIKAMSWTELGGVRIVTNDQGPWNPDVFWWLLDREGELRLVIPGGATGEGELLETLQKRLPDFDNEAVIEAMGSTGKATFECWRHAK